MKSLLIMFLVLIASVAAADLDDAQYIVVVGADAPASDVVIAANFAASMKSAMSVTFQSALDEDAYEQLDRLTGKTIVVINGEERLVKIIGTSNAAAAAKTYFTTQGFEVDEITRPTKEDLLLNPPEPVMPVEVIVPQPQETPAPVIQPNPLPTVQETPKEELTPPPAPEPAPQPNVVVMAWRWFKNLF